MNEVVVFIFSSDIYRELPRLGANYRGMQPLIFIE